MGGGGDGWRVASGFLFGHGGSHGVGQGMPFPLDSGQRRSRRLSGMSDKVSGGVSG